ncbi:MAG: dephospho-CoA kinase [Gammaproteobacteria bacterium RIFCSPHIGHO2_12_FULL_45_12]|nr:MAG: dephospho-CoA kinase [Gammaproteobacteria bacterium RIFCSPHIGHO2_12_FULL_45_12]
MLVIGLTGGIGSGKSTVAALFEKLGAPIIDADVIARQLTQPHQPAFTRIIEHFGDKLTQSDGSLNRRLLRQLIFADTTQRRWLESLLHPLIRECIQAQLNKLNAPYCLIVIPLLVETGAYPFLDRILVVDTLKEHQIARVAARDRLSVQDIHTLLQTQANRELRLSLADDVIHNDHDLTDLMPQVMRLHEQYAQNKTAPTTTK